MEWDRTKHRSKETVKERGKEEEKDSGREMNTDRVHVFHHAICAALINVSLSLQRRLLAETLQLVLSHPRPPSSSSPLLLRSPPMDPSLSPFADTIPPSSGAISRNVSRLQVTVRNSCERARLNPRSSQKTICVCVCVYAFPPHSM